MFHNVRGRRSISEDKLFLVLNGTETDGRFIILAADGSKVSASSSSSLSSSFFFLSAVIIGAVLSLC